MSILTLAEFVKEARAVHGNAYDYRKAVYMNNATKMCIVCPAHGEFWQRKTVHVNQGSGCPVCAVESARLMSTLQFVDRAKKVHGSRYSYEYAQYDGTKVPVCIVCPDHGEFYMRPKTHLAGGHCPRCRFDSQRKPVKIKEDKRSRNRLHAEKAFFTSARRKHGKKYDYSKVVYVNSSTHVTIICPKHGEFEQSPKIHSWHGGGCPKCANEHRSKNNPGTGTESYVHKHITRGGVAFKLQGHEPIALDWILNTVKLQPQEVLHGKDVPRVKYVLNGATRWHYPDFFVPKQNRLVEVKCLSTAGLGGLVGASFDQLRYKAKGAIASGYRYTLLLFSDDGSRKYSVPSNWHSMTKAELLRKLKCS